MRLSRLTVSPRIITFAGNRTKSLTFVPNSWCQRDATMTSSPSDY